MERGVKRTIENAIREAMADPEPPLTDLFTDVYDDNAEGIFPHILNLLTLLEF